MEVKVRMHTANLERKFKRLSDDLAGKGSGKMRATFKKWGDIYLKYAWLRFRQNMGGGGEWPALSPETVKRKGHSTILVDTYRLHDALSPRGKHGALAIKMLHDGVSLRFSKRKHSGSGKRARTFAQIADFHQKGQGRNPTRHIWHRVSRAAEVEMRDAMEKTLKELTRR